MNSKSMRRIAFLLFAAMWLCFAGFSSAAAARAEIKVSVYCPGYGGTVSMESLDQSEKYLANVGANGHSDILIYKDHPGITEYRIYMESVSGSDIRMDSTVYEATVYVEYEDDGTLAGTLQVEGSGGKTGSISFSNRKKSSSGSSSSSGTGKSSANTASVQKYTKPVSDSENPVASKGTWELQDSEEHIWKFLLSDGTYASGGCYYIQNSYSPSGPDTYDWFCFDENAQMNYGWWRPEGEPYSWYHFHAISDGDLGAMTRKWHLEDSDGRWYYLDPTDGRMVSGWQTIDGYEYYFEKAEDVPFSTWVSKQGGLLHWIYEKIGIRSYGSMYMDEITKDGSRVDQNGRKIA